MYVKKMWHEIACEEINVKQKNEINKQSNISSNGNEEEEA